MLKYASNERIRLIGEIVYNILQNNLTVPADLRKKLKRYKKLLRIVAGAKSTIAYKRKLLDENPQVLLNVINVMLKSNSPLIEYIKRLCDGTTKTEQDKS